MLDKAFFVGINSYVSAPLRGCVGDVQRIHERMRQRGFDDNETTLLTDGRATKALIVKNLKRLVYGVRPGDRIFFHQSGHGVQVPTRNTRDELDGMDECFCPVNFDWTPESYITDKEYHAIFSSIPVGVEAIFISDSCHSGDLDRDMPRPSADGRISTPRAMPVPVDIAHDLRTVKRKKLKWTPLGSKSRAAGLNMAFISGCEPDQTSADAPFPPNQWFGALTYYLTEAMDRLPKASLRQLVEATRKSLAANHFTQRPMLTGPDALLDRPFFAAGARNGAGAG